MKYISAINTMHLGHICMFSNNMSFHGEISAENFFTVGTFNVSWVVFHLVSFHIFPGAKFERTIFASQLDILPVSH